DRSAAPFKASVPAMLDEPIHDRWPELRVPTAVLFGAADRLIPNRLLHPRLTTKRLAESSRRRLPGTLTMVAGAGHMVHFERPAPVARAIEAFIAAPATLDAAG
ncbi:MAG: alpha/beta fold hydrolase, partial [Myxococcota bacterium]